MKLTYSKIENSENKNFNKLNAVKRKFNGEIVNDINKKIKNLANFELFSCNNEILKHPLSFKEIYGRPDEKLWLKAVENELNNMKNKRVYKYVSYIPKDKNVISCRWVFTYKKDDKGKINKYKARLVARGFSQILGIDYRETFSPTLKQDSLRIITALAVYYNFNIYQLDIKAAYLNADLEEELYMDIPQGDKNYNNGFWKLNKAIYGLKQAGRMWNFKINDTLLELGFNRCKSEPCVYIKKDRNNNIICILAIYVDDILIAGKNKEINKIREEIKSKFELSDIGEIDFIIGIKFVKCNDGYILHQSQYVDKILDEFKIDKYDEISNMMYYKNEKLSKKKFNQKLYMKAVGCLLYLAIGTRPDIMFATSKASRKNQDPTYEDWFNVLKIFRYLNGTKYYGLKFTNNIDLNIFVDADLGGDERTKRSTTGFLILMGSTPVSWYSKLQQCVAVSTAESEYYSLNECALKCLWIKNFLDELNINTGCMTIKIDNKAAIYNSKNETINPKSRHIDLKYHKIRELVKENKIDLKYIKSQYNLADGLTKYLNGTLTNKFRNTLLYKI